jgi:hypothetical protein
VRIRRRAYEIWEREGRPANSDLECWIKAECEILEEPIVAARALASEVAASLPKLAKGPRLSSAKKVAG